LKDSTFEKISQSLDSNKARDTENATVIAGVLRNEVDTKQFLVWISKKAIPTSQDAVVKITTAQSIKNFQNCINKAPTQKLIFGLEPTDKLTSKLRLKRANKQLLKDGLCTDADIKSKDYFLFETVIPEVVRDATEQLQKVQKEFQLTQKELTALVGAIKY
jgi:hypothetical protein